VRDLLSARRTQANNPGPVESTLVLVLEKQDQLQGQRGQTLVTHPRHTEVIASCAVGKRPEPRRHRQRRARTVTTRGMLCSAKEGVGINAVVPMPAAMGTTAWRQSQERSLAATTLA
jgi:hypothetical protein